MISTVHAWVDHVASQRPAGIAIEEGTHRLTYAELNRRSQQLARALVALEPGRAGTIAVMTPPGTALVTGLLAAFWSGRRYLPLDRHLADKRLGQMLEQCRPRVLVTADKERLAVGRKLAPLTHAVAYLVTVAEDGALALYQHRQGQFEPADWPPSAHQTGTLPVVTGEDANYIFYTSGSTGTAKAILGAHKSLKQFIEWEISEFGLDAACRVSQLIQPTFDASLRDIFAPLCAGGTLCIPTEEERGTIDQLVRWIAGRQITLVHCVPSLFRLLTKAIDREPGSPGVPFDKLAFVLISGEALYGRDVLQWREKAGSHVQLVNLYGATETTLIRTFYRVGEIDQDPAQVIPVGKPIAHTAVAIVNDGHLCRPNEIGEIYVKTPFWTKGYLFDEALNAKAFVQNPLVKDRPDVVYKTGDLGRYDKDRNVQVLGRTDNQVKVNGIRVELEEVEGAFRAITGIEQVLVTSYVTAQGDTELIAYYTGAPHPPEALRQHLRHSLGDNVLPGYYQHLPAFPLTINGKIDKKALPQPNALRAQEHPYEPVQNATERKLEEMWRAILDGQRIGRKVSFFAIGGSSLKAIQLISRVYKEFRVLVKVVDIFSHPTIEQLARFLAGAAQGAYADIAPVGGNGPDPATPQQRQLWILDQLEENQQAYHMPMAFELRGRLHLQSLEIAFGELIKRHESLRTVFEQVGDELYMRVTAPGEWIVTPGFADVSGQPDPEAAARERMYQAADTKLDLAKGPLVQALVIQLEADRHYLFVNTHHIISDAWSLNVIARDWLALYQWTRGEQASAPGPLTIQYRDYSAWQRARLEGAGESLRRYWLGQLEGELPRLELPTDLARPKKQTFKGGKHFFACEPALFQPVQAYCQQHDCTLFMFLMSAVNTLLYYYSGQKDIVVGVPLAGRNHRSLEDQVGFYVQVMALRTRFDPGQPFAGLVQQVKARMLDGYEHALFPFDQLAELLQVGGDRSRSGIFDVMVMMQDTQVKDLLLQLPDNLRLRQLDLNFQSSKFDLTFNFESSAGTLAGWIEYNSALFLPSTVAQMQALLETIIREVVQGPADCSPRSLKKTLADRFGVGQDVQQARFSAARLSEDF